MRRRQYSTTRNKLDLNDRFQVRVVRKRLRVSEEQLAGLVRKAGDSIAAVRKEAVAQRLLTLPGGRAPAVEVIAAVKEPEAAEEPAAVLG
jgi:hypothetical protein